MSLFLRPAILDYYLNMQPVSITIYLVSSFYIQLLGCNLFNKLRPYSYVLGPLCTLLPGNIMLLFFNELSSAIDANLFVFLAHFIIGFVVLNANMDSKNIRLAAGIAMIFFNTTGLVNFYSKGFNAYGTIGALICSYLPCVVISFVYVYIVAYMWQKHSVKLYANPKSLLQNTITFSVIFITVHLLHSINFQHVYIVVLAFYTLLYLDDNFWHKLPEFYSKAKLD